MPGLQTRLSRVLYPIRFCALDFSHVAKFSFSWQVIRNGSSQCSLIFKRIGDNWMKGRLRSYGKISHWKVLPIFCRHQDNKAHMKRLSVSTQEVMANEFLKDSVPPICSCLLQPLYIIVNNASLSHFLTTEKKISQ